MRKPRSALLFFVLLVLGLSLAVPVEDLPETAYDESEAQPYEGSPPVSILVSPVAARTTQKILSPLHLKAGAPSLFVFARVHVVDANRAGDARPLLALLCTRLC